MFDLDPPPGQFDVAVDVALILKEVLDRNGVDAIPKTSGAKGIHVYVPLRRHYDYESARIAAANLAYQVEARIPERATTEVRVVKREGKLFLDIGRNGPGAHIVAPYSPRARPGAAVSFPITWDELPTVRPEAFTIRTVPEIVAEHGNLWKRLMPAPQDLSAALSGGAAS